MFDKIKDAIIRPKSTDLEIGDDYIELGSEGVPQKKGKILIKLFTLNEFDDIKDILSAIREGNVISVVNINPLKEKDVMGLKRAIDKLKKTVEASEGDLAGIAENLLIATPSFARVHRGKKEPGAGAELPRTEVLDE